MEIIIIVLIIVVALGTYFITKLFTKALKIIIKLSIIIILVLVILTLLAYIDVQNMKKGFSESNNTFLLYKDNKVYSAITLKPLTNQSLSMESFDYYKQEKVQEINDALIKKEKIIINSKKTFMISPEALTKEYSLNLGTDLDQEELMEIIMSHDAFQTLAEKTKEEYGLSVEELKISFSELYEDQGLFKGYLFAALLGNYFQQQQSGELIKDFKNNKVQVSPETISFKIIRIIPII